MSKRTSFVDAALAAGAAALILLAEHYGLGALGIQLTVPWTYVAGVLALGVSYSIWCVSAGYWRPLAVFWVVVIAGGVAVIGAYALDWLYVEDTQTDWYTGAISLMIGLLLAVLLGMLCVSWQQFRQIKVLKAELALFGGLYDDVGEQ